MAFALNQMMLTKPPRKLVRQRPEISQEGCAWGSGLGHLWKAELNCWVQQKELAGSDELLLQESTKGIQQCIWLVEEKNQQT